MLEEMQMVAFQMIATVGAAKSYYVEAMREAKIGNYEVANQMITDGDAEFTKAHHFHFDLVQKEAQGQELPFSLMLMHAEDQMLTTETLKLMAVEIIELYSKVNAIESKI